MFKGKKTYTLLAIAFVCAAGGFMISFWPLQIAGIVLAGLAGHWLFAIVLGLLLDLAYGAPTGQLHALLFPCTALALAVVLLRRFGKRYFFDSSEQEKL